MTARTLRPGLTCSCGRVCRSRSGFATHARFCLVETARRAAYVDAIERGLSFAESQLLQVDAISRARDEIAGCRGSGVPSTVARYEDVRVLPVERRAWTHDPTAWAHDTHDELVALLCERCGRIESYWGEHTSDGDSCRCGSEATLRVIVGPHREHTEETY